MPISLTLKMRGHLRLKKAAALTLAVALSTAAVTAIAVEDRTSTTPSQAECSAFKSAAETAMKNHLSIVNSFMAGASSQMQAAVSKKNNCIGNLALLDFDLSKLIPDFGLLGMLLQTALDKLVTGVINKACNAISEVLAKPSSVWNSIMGQIDINDQFQGWAGGVNYKLPDIGGGSSGGSSGSGTGSGVVSPDIKLPVTCTETVGGTVCTDGTTSGSGISGDTPSGAQIGATYASLMAACSGALDQDNESGSSGPSAGSQAACNALQNFINQYYPYLDPAGIPKYPGFVITTPPGTGSAVCGDAGVCQPSAGGSAGTSSNSGVPSTTFLNGILGNGSSTAAPKSAQTKKSFSLPVRQ